MKKFCFMVMMLFVSVLSIKAQQTAIANHGQGDKGNRTMPTAQEMADKETQRQTKMLNLTTDQVAKVKTINLKYSQQRADLMKGMAQSQDRSAMQNKMQGIKLAQDNELKTVLTTDQQATLAKAHKGMDAENGENRGPGKKRNHGGGQRAGQGGGQGVNNN